MSGIAFVSICRWNKPWINGNHVPVPNKDSIIASNMHLKADASPFCLFGPTTQELRTNRFSRMHSLSHKFYSTHHHHLFLAFVFSLFSSNMFPRLCRLCTWLCLCHYMEHSSWFVHAMVIRVCGSPCTTYMCLQWSRCNNCGQRHKKPSVSNLSVRANLITSYLS